MTPEEMQAQIDKLAAEKAALEKSIIESASVDTVKRLTELETMTKMQAEENKRLKLDLTRKEVLSKYPGIPAPLQSTIVGDTPEALEARAKEISEMVAKTEAETRAKIEAEMKAKWNMVPSGTPPAMFNQTELEAEEKKAKENKDFVGMMKGKIIRLAHKMAPGAA